jgi:hypothetical protein
MQRLLALPSALLCLLALCLAVGAGVPGRARADVTSTSSVPPSTTPALEPATTTTTAAPAAGATASPPVTGATTSPSPPVSGTTSSPSAPATGTTADPSPAGAPSSAPSTDTPATAPSTVADGSTSAATGEQSVTSPGDQSQSVGSSTPPAVPETAAGAGPPSGPLASSTAPVDSQSPGASQPPVVPIPSAPVVAPPADSAGQSNSSAQSIWQVQVAGCLSGCDGTAQVQDAGQQNVTLQPNPSTPPTGTGSITSAITQLQIGCQQFCFDGTSTITSPPSAEPDSGMLAGLTALQQLLSNPTVLQQLLSGPDGLQQLLSGPGGLSQLLSALLPAEQILSGTDPMTAGGGDLVPGADQNVVDQASYQAQTGGSGTGGQTQIALQVNTTVQGDPALWAAATGSATALGAAGSSVDQSLQGIWQLQVGCIFYCTATQQVQQASESDTLIVATSGDPGSAVAVVNTAVMRIWQIQIGCLFWCYATVQLQSASTDASVLTVPVTVPAGGGSGSPSPGGSSSAGAPGSGGGDSPSGSGDVASPAGPSEVAAPRTEAVAITGPASPVGQRDSALPGPGGPVELLASAFAVQTPPPADTRPGSGGAGAGPLVGLTTPASSGPVDGLQSGGASVARSRAGRALRLTPLIQLTQLVRPAASADGGTSPTRLLLVLAGALILLLAAAVIRAAWGAMGRRI